MQYPTPPGRLAEGEPEGVGRAADAPQADPHPWHTITALILGWARWGSAPDGSPPFHPPHESCGAVSPGGVGAPPTKRAEWQNRGVRPGAGQGSGEDGRRTDPPTPGGLGVSPQSGPPGPRASRRSGGQPGGAPGGYPPRPSHHPPGGSGGYPPGRWCPQEPTSWVGAVPRCRPGGPPRPWVGGGCPGGPPRDTGGPPGTPRVHIFLGI